MDLAFARLRRRAPSNEVDYGFVMDCLRDYASPRAKLSRFLRSGELIRVKKGLYVFGEPFRQGDVSLEALANMIYGPSYVSLEWALSYYGLIPERVEEVTSVTTKRKRDYETPLGRFSYAHIHPSIYPVGLTLYEGLSPSLIATKEKAIVDQLIVRRGKVTSLIELEEILFEDIRIEEEDLKTLQIGLIEQIFLARPHSSTAYLRKLLQKMQS